MTFPVLAHPLLAPGKELLADMMKMKMTSFSFERCFIVNFTVCIKNY